SSSPATASGGTGARSSGSTCAAGLWTTTPASSRSEAKPHERPLPAPLPRVLGHRGADRRDDRRRILARAPRPRALSTAGSGAARSARLASAGRRGEPADAQGPVEAGGHAAGAGRGGADDLREGAQAMIADAREIIAADRDAWLAERRKGIGASEVAAALG